MIYRIKKGKHRAWPLSLGLWYDNTILRRKLSFDFNCRYQLDAEDQQDSNKLFGIGYLWNHQKESARFAWWFDMGKNRFILAAYCYVNGKRVITELCSVVANRQYILELIIMPDCYEFRVFDAERPAVRYGAASVDKTHKKKWSFPLGVFFGGNQAAPQTMTLQMKKI